MQLPLANQTCPVKSTVQNSQRLINLYSVPDSAAGRNSNVLYPTPGLTLFYDTGGLSVRGMLTVHNIVYGVTDNKFWSLTNDGVYTLIGNISTSSGQVSLAAIYDQVLIADGSTTHLYIISTQTYTTVASNLPQNVQYVAAQDEYFFAIQPGTDTFFVSNLSDGTTWQALMFAAVANLNGNLLAAVPLFGQMWFFKETETELWYNSGGSFPYQPQEGSNINYGTAAAFSVACGNQGIYWLAQTSDGSSLVCFISGNTPAVISTEGINYQISLMTTTNDAVGYTYTQEGHEFYVLTFPTGNKTFVYDITTQLWHERNSLNVQSGVAQPAYTRHRGNCAAYVATGTNLIGDYISGQVFRYSPEVYTDAGNTIERIMVTPVMSNSGRLLTIWSLDLFAEVGQGLVSGQGSDPKIVLNISRDAGFTWGNDIKRSLGKIGQYRKRIKWNQIGTARNFAFKFTITDPLKVILIGATVEIEAEQAFKWPKILSDG